MRDYYDVCPDYASSFASRMEEFEALVTRTHAAGLKCLIDFIPNHVARSYESDVRLEREFAGDDKSAFYSRENFFYYLEGSGKLTLPDGRGVYGELNSPARVTGNNSATWSPSSHDWFETVKLNYGYDYRDKSTLAALPSADAGHEEVPKTWNKMYEILHYWAGKGVDGVRCDMAHMVPVQFWAWVINKIRHDYPEFTFIAEAYAQDPMGCLPNNDLKDLTDVGFDAYYDQDLYHNLKGAVEYKQPVDSLGYVFFQHDQQSHGVRYIENHDEVRSSHPHHFGSYQQNLAATAVSWLTGSGPVMLYNGQEVGESAQGASGYSGDDGRSSIFDYICLPELQKWTNQGAFDGGGLSHEQRDLRAGVVNLLRLSNTEPFVSGETFGINYANEHLRDQGVFAFMRYSRDLYPKVSLVLACLHNHIPAQITLRVPRAALEAAGIEGGKLSALSVNGQRPSGVELNEEGDATFSVMLSSAYEIVRLVTVS